MPGIVVPVDGLALGPGYLYHAPLGSALPANTVAGSVFTDVWPVAWTPIGITAEGHEFNYSVESEAVDAAEYLDAIAYASTGREIGFAFEMARITSSLLKVAMNGGTITTTGSGATQLNEYAPPELGEETRIMIGWEATAGNERLVGYQAFQNGEVTTARRKGADKATLPVEFRLERSGTEKPFRHWMTGTAKA